MKVVTGAMHFDAASRKLTFDNRESILQFHLAKSLDGFKQVPDPVSIDTQTQEKYCFQWNELAQLQIRHYRHRGEMHCYDVEWIPLCSEFIPVDVIELGEAHWYGGAEMYEQRWPMEQQSIDMQHYVSHDYVQQPSCYGNVLEPIWFSSDAIGIYVHEKTPLHVSFNSNRNNQMELKADFNMSRYQNPLKQFPGLKYTVCIGKNMKQLWQGMLALFYKRPLSVPDELMLTNPVWSTWARYKVNINQEKVLEFADEIKNYGFANSQIEIDDMYTSTYGDFDFDDNKFPNPKEMSKTLHKMGFRLTTWVHPFANEDSEAYREGKANGYFIKDKTGTSTFITKWWQGNGAILDVTNESAKEWYVRRLRQFQNDYCIDSFKFDAGETNWLADDVCTAVPYLNPCTYITNYIDMISKFGSMVEARVAFKTQEYPVYVRVMDKHSTWGYDNGLQSMIPTVLLLGILGYPFILPDMIGGNGYPDNGNQDDIDAGLHSTTLPSKELYIRWTQLTAYLPSMQFSIVPWQYDEETVLIAKKSVVEHRTIVKPLLLEAAAESLESATPLIRPLWWLDDMDESCLTSDSQFLIGDSFLVAPVLLENARSRDIYLPAGKWKDNCRGGTLKGKQWLKNYAVKLDEVPTFNKL